MANETGDFAGYPPSDPIQGNDKIDLSRMNLDEGISGIEIAAYVVAGVAGVAIVAFVIYFLNRSSSKVSVSAIGDDLKLKDE